MAKLRTLALSIFCIAAFSGEAAGQGMESTDAETLENSEFLVASFAQCAGFWTWLSESTRRDGRPAAADYIKTYANGAYTSALWLLATRYAIENPAGEPKAYGFFGGLVDGPMEVERLRLTALEELGDGEPITQRHAVCEGLTEGSEQILKTMRDQRLGSP